MAKTPKKNRIQRKSPPLTDPHLSSRVDDAASHVGMSPAQLLDAIQNVLPPAEAQDHNLDVTSTTIDEIGYALTVHQNNLDDVEKPEFYRGLTDLQRGALVAHLTHVGFAPASIALAFGIQEFQVRDLWDSYSDRLGQRLQGIRIQTIIGNLQSRAETLYEAATKAGNYALAWKISKDHVKLLQDTGAVERAVHRTEVTHKLALDESQEREFQLAAELRQKQLQAKEEIKRIKAEPVEVLRHEMDQLEVDGE